jgi:outer membrane protein TolC
MRLHSLPCLLAALAGPLLGVSNAYAQEPPATAPATAPTSAPSVSPAPAAAPKAAPAAATEQPPAHAAPSPRVPHPSAVRPADAPTPSIEEIARAFDPTPNGLTSEEIVRLALAHSPELRKAELSEDTAKANKARASIAFAPRIDILGKYTRLSYVDSKGLAAGCEVNPPASTDPSEAALNAVCTLFRSVSFLPPLDQYYTSAGMSLPVTEMFLTVIPTYKGASAGAEVAALRTQAAELQVSFDARTAFYDYAHVIGAVIVAQRAVELYEATVADLTALVAAGTATETDLLRAKAQLAQAKVAVVRFTGEQEVALARLAVITGTELDAKRGIGEPFVGIDLSPTPEVSKLSADAKRSRPEVLALRKLQEVRTYLAKAKRGAQYPQLKGFANGYYANPLQRVVPPQDKFYPAWDVGVALSYSPNDSIYAHTQYKDALNDLASVHEDLRLTEDGIAMEAAHAVTTHRTAVADTQARTESLEAARRNRNDQRELMLAGAATPNDLFEAQLLLTRAALEWVDSYISVRIAEAALLKTQGKTGSSPQGPVVSRSTP